ncbi:MFS transporter [Cellulomonas cellasea]|uniref:MFS transporter n=2 Tax=Cellulomonas cellasea TaxID=43670 RepID=A0A4Y3L3A3_9CELL|nr:MFS transporter [Cellulomonas cellasea]GEA89620.1 MFS transporter [Cellulomonas cellasea]
MPRLPQRAGPGAFASLQVPAYRAWFASQVLSASGIVTQSVGAAWLVLELTGRAVDLALLSAATLLPVLLAGAWAGGLADRVDRRRLLVVTQCAFVGLALVLTALSASGAAQVWSLLLVNALSGAVNAVDAPTRQVYVMDLVGRERLASAVSLYEVILNASRVVGPAVGGVLLTLSGPTACFAANAASYLAPLLVLWRYPPATSGPAPGTAPRRRGAAREGLRYVWSTPVLRSCVLVAGATGVLFNASVLFPLLATRELGMDGAGYGALLACFGLGALPGALVAARLGQPTGAGVRVLALATGVAMALTGFSPTAGVAFAAMAVTGFVSIWCITAANTLVQLRAAPELRGRTLGVWTMALPGLNPVTGIAAATLADHAGARAGFAAGGAAIAVAALAGWRALGRDRAPEPAPGPGPDAVAQATPATR